MKLRQNTRVLSALRVYVTAASVLASVAGVIVMSGWFLEVPLFKSFLPGIPAMRFNTALGLLLLGASLWLLQNEKAGPARKRMGQILAGLALVISLLTLSEYLFGWNLGIDELFVRDLDSPPDLFPGRMSPIAALCAGLSSVALLMLGSKVSRYFSLAIVILSLAVIMNYLFDFQGLYIFPGNTYAAIHTNVIFLFMALALIAARPTRGMMSILSSNLPGSRIMRLLLPGIVILTILMGWLVETGEVAGFLDASKESILLVVLLILVYSPLIYFIARDINQAEELFYLTVESAPHAIALVDKQGSIVMVNSQAEKYFGYERAELIGLDVERLVPERFRRQHARQREGYLTDPQARPLGMGRDLYGLRKDGGEFPLEIGLTPIETSDGLLVITTMIDITDRKRAEEQLARQNRRLKALREIDTAILASDLVENIVRAALDHIRELIGCERANLALIEWERNEAVNFDVRDSKVSAISKGARVSLDLIQDILQVLSRNQPVIIDDLTTLPDPPPQIKIFIKEGLRSRCILPLFSQGNLIGSFTLSSEIPGYFDEEKINLGREVANQVAIAITQSNLVNALRELNAALEQRVVERTAQLQAANKELEAFTYSVSHDLRAPLRAINGFSQALLNKSSASLGEQDKHFLKRIQENTSRMGELIDDLLSLARLSRREMKQDVVDLSTMAREIAAELSTQEPERQVTFEIEDRLQGRGDAGLIRIVLQNLLGNAWKFTSTRAQAQINFGIFPSPLPPSPSGRGVGGEGEGEIVYCIRDNGVGFDMAYADKLFAVFQRLHSEAEFHGTGIGLATVQRIVHRHGGRIWAEAELDKGAAFYFTLGSSDPKGFGNP